MGNLIAMGGPAGLALFLLLCVGAFFLYRYRTRSTPIHPCHPGKADTHKCKFDRDEAKRPHLLPPPPIDLSNLPPPDPAVVALLQGVTAAGVEDKLRQLTGAKSTSINGNTVTIASRNTFASDFELALQWLEQFYGKLAKDNPGAKITFSRHSYVRRGKTLYNLIVTIPGKVNPDKYLLVGSHLDCTAGDTGRAEKRASGADDDGSGSIACTEVATAAVALQLPFTVQICHFSGEEQGLWGSYTYSDKVARDKLDIIDVIQLDMVAWCNKKGNRIDIHDEVDRNDSHAIVVKLFRSVARYKLNLTPVDTHNRALKDRSDHSSFLDHGYSAVLVSEEFTDDGFNPNYHSLGDNVDSIKGTIGGIEFMVEVIRMIIGALPDFGSDK